MSENKAPMPPFASKADFLAVGIWATTLHSPLDCSICLEPLMLANTPLSNQPETEGAELYRLPILSHADSDFTTIYNTNITQNNSSDSTNHPVPEQPVRITPCNHIFGSTCLHTWFSNKASTSKISANRCPECNTTLFPQSLHLRIRWPTHADRLGVALFLEQEIGDGDMAARIREDPMGVWMDEFIRRSVRNLRRSMGYNVTWEYINAGREEEESGVRVEFGRGIGNPIERSPENDMYIELGDEDEGEEISPAS